MNISEKNINYLRLGFSYEIFNNFIPESMRPPWEHLRTNIKLSSDENVILLNLNMKITLFK